MSLINVTDNSFELEVLQYKGLVLVDFWAPWCNPCKMLSPILEEISIEQKNIKIIQLNIDKNNRIANKFGIRSIPTLVLFKNGQMIEIKVGVFNKKIIQRWLLEFI